MTLLQATDVRKLTPPPPSSDEEISCNMTPPSLRLS